MDKVLDFNVAQDFLNVGAGSDFTVLTSADTAALGKANSYAQLLAAADNLNKKIVVGYDNANTYVFVDTNDDGTLGFAVQLVGVKGSAIAESIKIGVYV